MQKINIYLRADSVSAKVVDSYNQVINDVPSIVRGVKSTLVLKLLKDDGTPIENLDQFVSWEFVLATDWLTSTTPQIMVCNNITTTENEVHIPLLETNTEELISALSNQEKISIGAELVGFESGETTPSFLIQFNMQVRNRRSDAGTGSPEPVADGNYSAAQIDALLNAGFDVAMNEYNTAFKFRNAQVGGEWSPWIFMPIGEKGDKGEKGNTGLTGEQGIPGIQGIQGAKGDIGETGPQGEKGDTGDAFKIDASGTDKSIYDNELATFSFMKLDTGDLYIKLSDDTADWSEPIPFRGPQGEIGPRGETGATGDTGSQGLQGIKGDTGSQGEIGPKGDTGEKGDTGPQGLQGVKGDTGSQGLQGIQGITGEQGVKGDKGDVGDIEVASLDTSITQVNRLVFSNATITQGDIGEVIINFKNAGTTANYDPNNFSIFNGGCYASDGKSGSRSGGISVNITSNYSITKFISIENYSTFKG